jgi:sucrose-6-phosphate hydrolase SacC (GH32 family)
MRPWFVLSIVPILLYLPSSRLRASDKDIVFADFEGDTYGDWKTTGTAFGKGPARGTLPGQMEVSGYQGKGLVNSFLGGDASVGTLTSPEFKIERKYVSFLIGGGGFPGKTCMNLIIDGKTARTATGPNTEPGGSEKLEADGWDLGEFAGKTARIQIVDDATGGWGHITVDYIVFTDQKPPMTVADAARDLTVTNRYVHLPIKTGGPHRKVRLFLNDKPTRELEIELADGAPDWWAPLDASAWKGQKLTLRAGRLPAESKGLTAIDQSDELKTSVPLYQEALRPQLHFSPQCGWTNDPNGLVFADGEYHLFFQHNPFGWAWGNMHWGHAVSKDLIHWEEKGDVLHPDSFGPMFSGSAVVDHDNTSGFGKNGQAPLVLIYTAAGNPTVQCLAFSTDSGKTFTKYAGNPVVKEITGGNRDPKVIWHGPTKQWVMVLYVGQGDKHTIHFLTSPNLKDWKVKSKVDGLFECPDLFALPLNGDPNKKKWILTAASHEYLVGTFDGNTFTPETSKLPGERGKGFYAAQTFSGIPAKDGRRIQVGWLQAETPGMPFNQAMSVPLDVNLISTKDGPRLTWNPVRELESSRAQAVKKHELTLHPDDPNPLTAVSGELLDVVASLEPGKATEVAFNVRGVPVIYDVSKQELVVNGHRVPIPFQDGKLDLRILTDRSAFEVFATGGLIYIPMPVRPTAENRSVSVSVKGGPVTFSKLEAYQLKSIWTNMARPKK